MRFKLITIHTCLIGIGLINWGCNNHGAGKSEQTRQPSSDAVAAWKQQWLLEEAPSEPLAVLEARKQLSAGEAEASPEAASRSELAIVGRIGGMPNPWQEAEPDFPWQQGQASFFLVDVTTADGFADHQHDSGEDETDCPFCRRRAEQSVDSIALVQLRPQHGEPPAYRADQILPIGTNDKVVVRGRASLVAGSVMVVDATGIFVESVSSSADESP